MPDFKPKNFFLVDKIVGDAKIVCYGESSHGIQGCHDFNSMLFKHLALNKGFRVMLFECSWEIMYKMNAYFDDPDDSKLDDYCSFYLNAFDSPPSRELLKWIKDFNRNNPDDKITVAGFQPEQPVTDANGLKEYFSAVTVPAGIIEVLNKHAFFNGSYINDLVCIQDYYNDFRQCKQTLITPRHLIELLNKLSDLEVFILANKDKVTPQFYAKSLCHTKSLVGWIGVLCYQLQRIFAFDKDNAYYNIFTIDEGKTIYNKGDKIRMDIFELQKHYVYPDKKVYIWQHQFHAAKASFASQMIETITGNETFNEACVFPDNPITMSGVWLDYRYGKDFVVIGTVLPRTQETNNKAIDYYFRKKYGDNVVLVDLKDKASLPENTDKEMLLYERSNNGYFTTFIIEKQFDAVLYLPSSPRIDNKPLTGGR